MTFTTTKLVGHRTLVKGKDAAGNDGQAVFDSAQWDELNGRGQFDKAAAAFDAVVEEFFAPITAAADAVEAAAKKPGDDPSTYVVIQEGVEATPAKDHVVAMLSHDSIVLRLIEAGQHDRLIWVGETLEVIAEAAGFPAGGTPPSQPAASTSGLTQDLGGLGTE